jgi:hypothetical protein
MNYKQTSWELVSSGSAGIGVSPVPILSVSATGGNLYIKDGVAKKTHTLNFGYVSAGIGVSVLPVEFTTSFAAFPSFGTRVCSGPGANKPGSLTLNEFKGECLILSGAANLLPCVPSGGQASLIFFGLPSPIGSNWGFWATAASELFEATTSVIPGGVAAAPLMTALNMCSAVGFLAGMVADSTPSAGITFSRGAVL